MIDIGVMQTVVYRAAVIGAGPAGLACVGNLLDRLKMSVNDRILWIDPRFSAGRLENYPQVPSNTKVCLFTRFAEACESFKCAESKTYKSLVEDFDPQRGCQLKWAAELCKELTAGIKGQVDTFQGQVDAIEHSVDGFWNVKILDQSFKAKLIFLATGSRPKDAPPPGDATIHLDDALNPQILESKYAETDTISVYGSSHSAMLVLKNLLDSPKSPARIINIYRQEARFAEFPDPLNCPDKILHDNTGLKGETAEWARTWVYLTAEELEKKFGGKLIRVKVTTGGGDGVKAADKSIFAIGYERNPLPAIIYSSSSTPLDPSSLDCTPSGQLKTADIPAIEGLFGFGIAFPERVVDLDGTGEAAVGLWKFMRHIKKSFDLIMIRD